MSKLRVDEIATFTAGKMKVNGSTLESAAFIASGSGINEIPTNGGRDERDNTFTGNNSFSSPVSVANATAGNHAVALGQFVSGSNANGHYLIFPDGHMICRIRRLNLVFSNSTFLVGTWTFPHLFLNTDYSVSHTLTGPLDSSSASSATVNASINNAEISGFAVGSRSVSSLQASIARAEAETPFVSGNVMYVDLTATGMADI